MNFEINGIGFVNKGAELMMYSIIHQIREWDTRHNVAVNIKTGNYSQRSKVGLYCIPWANYKRAPFLGEILSGISQLIPKEVLLNYKVIRYSDIEVILDSSGFAYSDQWGEDFITDLLKLTNRWRESGKKIIFLPQAFGPFNVQQNRLNMMAVIKNADLIYARDSHSFKHLLELEKGNSKIMLSPDFTNLIEGLIPDYIAKFNNLACLVPNVRMIDKHSSFDQESYIRFFQSTAQFLIEHGFDVIFLVHELNDSRLANELISRVGQNSQIITEKNPIILKGIIGQSKVVVGSRYHALVSSLSQGIPTLGTSWSHKYQALFDDYNCPEYLITNDDLGLDLETKLASLLFDPNRSMLINRLNIASQEQKNRTRKMWDDIYNHLFQSSTLA